MIHLTTDTRRTLHYGGVTHHLKLYSCKKCKSIFEFFSDKKLVCSCGAKIPKVYDLTRFPSDRIRHHLVGENF